MISEPWGAALDFLSAYKQSDPQARKADVEKAFVDAFSNHRMRSVYVADGYALRFTEANGPTFSNTVLSLSALQRHDREPFIVVIVRPGGVEFRLSNTSLLRKISHSSRDLTLDRLRGSFNGTDILSSLDGLSNERRNFPDLFAHHAAFTWEENLGRLVEATSAILPAGSPFRVSIADRESILNAPQRTANMLSAGLFSELQDRLDRIVQTASEDVLRIARVENVNLRGNAIEELITHLTPQHRLEDIGLRHPGGVLGVDVKTTTIGKSSAPKGYNVDKMLAWLASVEHTAAFYFIGVDSSAGRIATRLVPIFDWTVLDATHVTHHWAGRASRGVTQLDGRFKVVLDAGFSSIVDVSSSRDFLIGLLDS